MIRAWQLRMRVAEGVALNDEGASSDVYAREFNLMLLGLAHEFDDGQSFVVRLQPVLRGFRFEQRLLDSFTCFHPNRVLISELAYGLLQNMLAFQSADQVSHLAIYDRNAPSLPAAEKASAARRAHVNAAALVAQDNPADPPSIRALKAAIRAADASNKTDVLR